MPRDTVVVGIAGAGKTTYAMDVLEGLMRNGVNPMQIGFCSFSRAACAEAAERAEKVTGVGRTDLQKSGWFRTIHSAVLRSLGIDRDAILDHDSTDGQKWMNEHCLSARGNKSSVDERGTLASLVGDALTKWDNHRSRLNSTIPPKIPSFMLGDFVSGLDRTEQSGSQSENVCGSEGLPDCIQSDGVDTSRAKNAGLSHPKDISVYTVAHPLCATVWTLSHGKTLGFRECDTHLYLYRAKMKFILGERYSQKYACRSEKGVDGVASDGDIFSPIARMYMGEKSLSTPSVSDGVDSVDKVAKKAADDVTSGDGRSLEHLGIGGGRAGLGGGEYITSDGLITGKGWKNTWCVSLESLSSEQKNVIEVYENNKRIYGKMDFTDLLLHFLGVEYDADGSIKHWVSPTVSPLLAGGAEGVAAGVAAVDHWFFDEYQDCSVLLDMCAQRLSEAAGERWFLGDRFQCIYDFNASDEACVAHREAGAEKQVLLNRTWRNPECVVDWGEKVLSERKDYVSRCPVAEGDQGSVGLMEHGEFEALVPLLGRQDVMILGRAWFQLARVKTLLDGHGVPWSSLSDKHGSRWSAPVKLAFTLVMRDLTAGELISEQDWRRVTESLPAKVDGAEVFVRGTKTKWKKAECSVVRTMRLDGLSAWGATPKFFEIVATGAWKKDMPLLFSEAIDRFGIDIVRRPRVRIGTCHSCKGMEAENVFCIAKSTPAAAANDETCLKYVTITRASVNYRLVVDPFDLARGVPLFWAAPRAAQFVKGIDLGTGSQTADEMFELTEDEADSTRRCLVGEDRWVPDAEKGSPGSPDLPEREVDRGRVQSGGGEVDGTAGSRDPEDQECWWGF